MPQRIHIASAIVLVLWTFAVFSSALDAGLLNWDDPLYLDSPAVRNLDWGAIFGGPLIANYHPLTLVSLGLEQRWLGRDPFVHHLVNVLVHVLNTLLVAAFLRRLVSDRAWVAWLAAALFAVHPLHVESVAWISERKDVLSLCFTLLCLIVYLGYAERGGVARYAAVSLSLAAALLTKPMSVTVPVLMLGLDWLRRRPFAPRLLWEKLPFFAAALAIGIASLRIQAPEASGDLAIFALGPQGRVLLALESLVFYLSKTLWPVGLAAVYDAAVAHVGPADLARAAALAGGLGIFAWRTPDARRLVLFAVGFFLVTIAPVLKVLPFGSHSLFNDRYMYLPSVGLFLALALPLGGLPRWPLLWRIPAAAGAAAVGVALSFASHERCRVWRSSETLWLDVLARQPEATTALNNLGRHYLDEAGDPARARPYFERAAAARPDSPDPLYNLGLVAWREGNRAEAARHFERALEIWPGGASNRMAIAHFYAEGGDLERAASHYRRVVEDLPDSAEAAHNLGDLYRAQGQSGRARQAYERALAIAPELGPSHAALAAIYLEQGDPARAREAAERARALGTRLPPALSRRLSEGRTLR